VEIAGLVLGAAGFAISLLALGAAIWQVRDTRHVSRLQAEITVIEAFLAREFSRHPPRPEKLQKQFLELSNRASELAGGVEALEMMVGGLK
jgi:hypothetical protein